MFRLDEIVMNHTEKVERFKEFWWMFFFALDFRIMKTKNMLVQPVCSNLCFCIAAIKIHSGRQFQIVIHPFDEVCCVGDVKGQR